ncbi:MAG: penicillin-binding protein 2 [Acidimicrobiales bacterium]
MSKPRVFALLVVLSLVAGAFSWRLVDLQLTPDAALADEVGSQVRSDTIPAPRGQIVDRFGRPISFSLPRPTVVANPRLLQAADVADETVDLLDEAVASLAPLLSTDPVELRDRLSRDKAYVNLERQVDPEIGEAVEALAIPGVYLVEEQRREHPHGDCSGIAVVGRVDVDQVGISGLEETYDDLLTGDAGTAVRQTQAGGSVQIPGGFRIVEPMAPGTDLALTLDRSVQFRAEELLQTALDEAGGDRAIAIVSDPITGEILTMANVTRDDETGLGRCTTTNLAATWAYEPGSIMKALTFASVFENDAWPEFLPIEVPRVLRIDLGAEGTFPYTDINIPGEAEEHTPEWALAKSSNNATIIMAQEVGPDALYDTFVDLGLGRPTGLDLTGEASGILDSLDSNALELSNAAIGQGVAVTPLQMLMAYNTIAAGGVRVEPTLLAEPLANGDDIAVDRVLSAETAATLMRMLTEVVDGGTGHRAEVAGYTVSGKTGTAWQPCDVGYFCDDGTKHRTASFAGIVSNDSGPALSAIVVVDGIADPDAGGGSVAAPVFAELAAYALQQMRVPPLSDGEVPDRVRASAAVPVVATDADGATDAAGASETAAQESP